MKSVEGIANFQLISSNMGKIKSWAVESLKKMLSQTSLDLSKEFINCSTQYVCTSISKSQPKYKKSGYPEFHFVPPKRKTPQPIP